MRSAAARIHWSARGTSLTSSQAQKNPQKIPSTVATSVISPAHRPPPAPRREDQPLLDAIGQDEQAAEIPSASNSMSGSPKRRPTAIASRSSDSRACGSGSEKRLDDQHPAVLGPVLARLLEDACGPRANRSCTAQSPSTLPVIQASVRAARPAASPVALGGRRRRRARSARPRRSTHARGTAPSARPSSASPDSVSARASSNAGGRLRRHRRVGPPCLVRSVASSPADDGTTTSTPVLVGDQCGGLSPLVLAWTTDRRDLSTYVGHVPEESSA